MNKALCLLLGALLFAAPLFGSASTDNRGAPADKITAAEIKTLYLTFDDGPTDSTTPKILDILRDKNVRATFFIIGRQIRGREEIVRRTFREGHGIGIHSYTHEYSAIYKSDDALLSDIRKCKRAIEEVLPGFSTMLYRFPGGSFLCPQYRQTVSDAGYHYVDWNASSDDAVLAKATPQELFDRAVNSAQGKSKIILLMHDGVGKKATVQSLPAIIDHFSEKGYVFAVLNDV